VTFADGWVCRACWKPNRARDERCYRCKTERDADGATVDTRRAERLEKEARRDQVPPIVGEIPARIFGWYGWFGLVGAFFAAVGLVIAIGGGEDRAGDVPVIAAITVGTLVYAVTLRWASAEMRAANPWAFGVALIVSVAAVTFYLVVLSAIPPNIGDQSILRYAGVVIFGVAGTVAALGLVMSLRARRGPPPA
jgi:hypothetical protein